MSAERSRISQTPLAGPLSSQLSGSPDRGCHLYWLGQAGFVLEIGGYRLVIDPYLSDSLALKYEAACFSHERMMEAPITPEEFGQVDLVLSTHAHTDHMDAATLIPLMSAQPGAHLIAPVAERAKAEERSGVDGSRMILLDAGEETEPLPGLRITATAAAHETRETDQAGHHRFLGYSISFDGMSIWHSGDCVPFEGLVDTVGRLKPDIALLPVNGRRGELSAQGVPGNFSLEEAVDIAEAVGARAMLAHHYGMFAFNSCDPAMIDRVGETETRLAVLRARTGIRYDIGQRPRPRNQEAFPID